MNDDDATQLLSALADPTRRRALRLLWQGRELCVCELMQRLRVTQSRMSRHMAVLKAAGLVEDRRVAQWVRYRLCSSLPKDTLRIVSAVMEANQTSTGRGLRRAASARPQEIAR